MFPINTESEMFKEHFSEVYRKPSQSNKMAPPALKALLFLKRDLLIVTFPALTIAMAPPLRFSEFSKLQFSIKKVLLTFLFNNVSSNLSAPPPATDQDLISVKLLFLTESFFISERKTPVDLFTEAFL